VDVRLWFGFLGAPTAWAIGLGVQYALIEGACDGQARAPLHVASVVTLLIALGAGWVALQDWTALGRPMGVQGGDPAGRRGFMVTMGVALGALFVLAILAQWLGVAFLHPCMGL
jgi:hypothetical protein